MADTMDRPIDEITRSVMAVILSGRIKGQFARDLEKLCAVALSAAPPAAAPTREQVREAWRKRRESLGVNCPGCNVKEPKRTPTILLPNQRCKVCGYRDPRPREKE